MSNPVAPSDSPAVDSEQAGLSLGQWALVLSIMGVGLLLIGWTAVKVLTTPPEKPNIAKEAERYLRFRKAVPLSEEMSTFLNQHKPFLVKTQDHPLLGKPAPDFYLRDPDGKMVRLSSLLEKGPVVVVFYYGYWCDHCVAQLFGINEDLPMFHELGAQVVAVSADPPELTRERFAEYGRFKFPTVSDPGSEVAAKYSVFTPAKEGVPEELFHGTFVIGPDGTVQWAELGDQPFLHNPTLLFKLAELQGRLPEEEDAPKTELETDSTKTDSKSNAPTEPAKAANAAKAESTSSQPPADTK